VADFVNGHITGTAVVSVLISIGAELILKSSDAATLTPPISAIICTDSLPQRARRLVGVPVRDRDGAVADRPYYVGRPARTQHPER
jgi:hypothetical protein